MFTAFGLLHVSRCLLQKVGESDSSWLKLVAVFIDWLLSSVRSMAHGIRKNVT